MRMIFNNPIQETAANKKTLLLETKDGFSNTTSELLYFLIETKK